MCVRPTRKGQITIPQRVCDHLNIKPGSAVDFTLADDGRVVLIKTGGRTATDPSVFARIRGMATAGMSTDEIMALTRGDVRN
jgi:AbrB family looped-hinge helix DNA binding protein